eukprot:TRINITY_DN13966_c0_g1_i2.p1 TRINITY_DN13966_c0_g1~~TRINITY_DN13966_c0_g1_i2.p1  ORF type:complete len:569 (+),score=132.42 TRINITY_DN13966_c0_g1_i2:89-1708(+)
MCIRDSHGIPPELIARLNQAISGNHIRDIENAVTDIERALIHKPHAFWAQLPEKLEQAAHRKQELIDSYGELLEIETTRLHSQGFCTIEKVYEGIAKNTIYCSDLRDLAAQHLWAPGSETPRKQAIDEILANNIEESVVNTLLEMLRNHASPVELRALAKERLLDEERLARLQFMGHVSITAVVVELPEKLSKGPQLEDTEALDNLCCTAQLVLGITDRQRVELADEQADAIQAALEPCTKRYQEFVQQARDTLSTACKAQGVTVSREPVHKEVAIQIASLQAALKHGTLAPLVRELAQQDLLVAQAELRELKQTSLQEEAERQIRELRRLKQGKGKSELEGLLEIQGTVGLSPTQKALLTKLMEEIIEEDGLVTFSEHSMVLETTDDPVTWQKSRTAIKASIDQIDTYFEGGLPSTLIPSYFRCVALIAETKEDKSKPMLAKQEEWFVNQSITSLKAEFRTLESDAATVITRDKSIEKIQRIVRSVDQMRWRDMTEGLPLVLEEPLRQAAEYGVMSEALHKRQLRAGCCSGGDACIVC